MFVSLLGGNTSEGLDERTDSGQSRTAAAHKARDGTDSETRAKKGLSLPVGISSSMSLLTEESEDRAQRSRNKHAHLLLEQSSRSPVQQRLLRREAEVKPNGGR